MNKLADKRANLLKLLYRAANQEGRRGNRERERERDKKGRQEWEALR